MWTMKETEMSNWNGKKKHFFIQIISKSILHLNRGANKLHHIPFVYKRRFEDVITLVSDVITFDKKKKKKRK